MKYTILGFNQEVVVNMVENNKKGELIKLDIVDLTILRWIVDFYPTMTKIETGGVQYVWLNYKALLDDMPILSMAKNNLYKRLQKMCELGILKHTTVRNGGTYSYYAFGKRYSELIKCTPIENNQYPIENNQYPIENNQYPIENNQYPLLKKFNTPIENFQEQNNPSTIYPSTKDNPSTISITSNKFDYDNIVDLFNSICVSFPKVTKLSEARKKAIKVRFNNGYTKDDFEKIFTHAENSDFLKGKSTDWQANFDWLIKETNMIKVLEGNYANKDGPAKPQIKYESKDDSFMRGVNSLISSKESE